MLTLASHVEHDLPARSRPDGKAAHYDVAVVTAGGFRATSASPSRPVDHLVDGLSARTTSTVLLNCAEASAPEFPERTRHDAFSRGATVHKVIRLPSHSQIGERNHRYPDGCPDPIFYTAMKLLCFDDQLFNLKGGCDFVAMSVAAARRAGRMTALLCTDLRTEFTKSREIADSFGGVFDVVVGEPAAVLSLFGVSRIDTLVPKLMQCGTGLVLHRIDFPPVCLRPQSTAIEVGASPISATMFWSEFVPSAFNELLAPEQQLTA